MRQNTKNERMRDRIRGHKHSRCERIQIARLNLFKTSWQMPSHGTQIHVRIIYTRHIQC